MASFTSGSKEYGLIKRTSNKPVIGPKLSIFDEDSDEDGARGVGKQLQKEAGKIQTKRQLKLDLQSALIDDPSVFQYDEVYDDIVQKRQEQIRKEKRVKDKKPQYIEALLKAAKARKLDQEKVLERKIQKEREAEGEEFAEKEAFVTSAYKKKMLELQELEEREKREADLEALTDVTKQKDLSGFYRQLYRQTLCSTKDETESNNNVDDSSTSTITKDTNDVKDEQKSEMIDKQKGAFKATEQRRQRQFRNTRHSSSSSDSESETKRTKRRDISNQKRPHDDNDDSSESEKDLPRKTSREDSDSKSGDERPREKRDKDDDDKLSNKTVSTNSSEKENIDSSDPSVKKKQEAEATKEKLIALFTKRHVGEIYQNARERYLKRKELRQMFPLIPDNPE